jgi:hypothetical protein
MRHGRGFMQGRFFSRLKDGARREPPFDRLRASVSIYATPGKQKPGPPWGDPGLLQSYQYPEAYQKKS